MKLKKTRRFIALIGAGLAAASILAACSDGGDNKDSSEATENASDQTSAAAGSQSAETTTASGQAEETSQSAETGETESAVADVYGDGVDPVTAKSSENGLGFLREQLGSTVGTMCGFAYLGTVKDGASVKDVVSNSATAKSFVFIKDMDTEKIVSDGGDDIFVFVPTDENAKVAVNTFAESDSGKCIYTSDKGTPILIRTKDELNDSMEIVITDSLGNVGHFAPDISTGSIADTIYKDVTAYNFSADVTQSANVNRQFMLDSLLARDPGLSDKLANGELRLSEDSFKRIYIDDIEFYTLDFGHMDGSNFVKDRHYAVSKDATLMYIYDPVEKDWMDLLSYDWNAAQYR